MPIGRTISRSFTVETIEDGQSAPFYHDQYYGWSAIGSTNSSTTAPSDVTWYRYVPAKPTGKEFLWLKDTLFVFNEDQNEYQQQGSTTYTRINGEDGKGIQIKGTVIAVEQTALPTTGVNNGDMGLLRGDSHVYTYNSGTWIPSSSAASVGDGYILQSDGYIWVWNGSVWQRGGQVKGEDGKSSYIHIAWAHDIDPMVGYPTEGMGFTTSKNPEDKYEYIGIATNDDPNDDPELPQDYLWDEVEGVGGTTFYVQSSLSSITIPSNSASTSPGAITFRAYSKVGEDDGEALSCYFVVFRKSGSTYTVLARSTTTATSYTLSARSYNANDYDSIVCCIFGSLVSSPTHVGYLAELEVPVRKNGDNAILLDLDNENDSMIYKADQTTLVGTKPTTSWHLYRGGEDITNSVTHNATNCRFTATGCTASWTATSGANAYSTIQVDGLSSDSASILVSIVYGGVTYNSTMTIKRLIGIDKYELVVSPNGIAVNTTDDSKSTSKVVNIKVMKTDANDGVRSLQFPISTSASPCYMYLVPINSDGTEGSWQLVQSGTGSNYYNSSNGYTFTASTAFSAYHVVLLKASHGANDVVIDSESIPISKVSDGRGIQSVTMAYAISQYGTSANDATPPEIQGSWSATPTSMTNTYRYLWRRETTTYTQGNPMVKYYLMASKGEDATSVIMLDLTNEMDGVALDDNGKVIAQTTIETRMKLYVGSEAQVIARSNISVSGLSQGVTYSISDSGTTEPHISIVFEAGTTLPNDRQRVLISATRDGVTYSSTLSVIGQRGGYTYQISPSDTSISRKVDVNTPSTISCNVVKNGGQNTETNPTGVVVTYTVDGGEEQSYALGSGQVSTVGVSHDITFICRVNGVIYDRETILVVSSATPTPYHDIKYGWSGMTQTANNTTPPSDVSSWSRAIPTSVSSKPYLWMQDTYYVYNTTTEQYAASSITYARLTGESGVGIHPKGSVIAVRNSQSDFYTMPGTTGDLGIYTYSPRLMRYDGTYWSDNGPVASTGDCYFDKELGHLWAYNDGQWYDMGQIAGENGTSAFVHFAFANSLGPTSPSQAGYPDWTGLDTGFTTAKAAGQRFKYMGVLSNEDGGEDPDITHAGEYSWTEVEGAPSIHYEIILDGQTWANVNSSRMLNARINGHAYRIEGTSRTPVANYNVRVGFSQSTQGATTVTTSATGGFSSVRNNFDWEYLGNSTTMYVNLLDSGGNVLASATLPIAVTGESGAKGDIGRNIYYDYTWSDTKTYRATSINAPYVSVVKADWVQEQNPDYTLRFFLLTGENGTETNYSTDQNPRYPWEAGSPWVEMTADFKYMITEAIFSEFAKLGSGIFNKDWLFSQFGQHGEMQDEHYEFFEPDFANNDVLTIIGTSTSITATSQEPYIIREIPLAPGIEHSLRLKGNVGTNGETLHFHIVNRDNADNVLADISIGTTQETEQLATITSIPGGTYIVQAWVSGGTGYITSLTMQATSPFIPNVAIDWFRGYAHFGNGRTRFNEDGSGHLANGKISWDASGNASFAGRVEADSGEIGDFDITDGSLQIGDSSDWDIMPTSPQNASLLASGRARFQRWINDINTKIAFGHGTFNAGNKSSAVVLRNVRNNAQASYDPALDVRDIGNTGQEIAMRTVGVNVAASGMISCGVFQSFLTSGGSYTINPATGSEYVFRNKFASTTSTVYLPSKEVLQNFVSSLGNNSFGFAVHIRIINAPTSANGGYIRIRFNDSTTVCYNHDGSLYWGGGGYVDLGKGRMITLMLIRDNTESLDSFYALRLTHTQV